MQLQKLVYIAHGFCLGLLDEPLIGGQPEAWQYGPVFPTLYRTLRHYGSGEVTDLLSTKEQVTDPRQIEVIQGVWQGYGHLSGPQLSSLTHKVGSPWETCRDGTFGAVIPDAVIKQHYKNLLAGTDNGVR